MQHGGLDSRAMDRFRRFDEAYYHRFYENPVTRVHSADEHANLAEFVFAYSRWNKLEVKTVLESLITVGHRELKKAGIFTLPGFAKFRVVKKPATKARQGINPFTKQPTTFAAKPASKAVRARPIKAIKDAVA